MQYITCSTLNYSSNNVKNCWSMLQSSVSQPGFQRTLGFHHNLLITSRWTVYCIPKLGGTKPPHPLHHCHALNLAAPSYASQVPVCDIAWERLDRKASGKPRIKFSSFLEPLCIRKITIDPSIVPSGFHLVPLCWSRGHQGEHLREKKKKFKYSTNLWFWF